MPSKKETPLVPKKIGRPFTPIDWAAFEKMCEIQCTQVEMASVLGITDDTLKTRSEAHYGMSYSDIYKKYSCGGKKCLRRIQYDLAHQNTSMAIWLGKQWLGQRDHPVEESTNVKTAFDDFNTAINSLAEQMKRSQGTLGS